MEIEDEPATGRPGKEEQNKEKKAEEKKTRAVLILCCIIITAAILFSSIMSIIQHNNINRAIRNINTNSVEQKLNDLKDELSNIERYLRHR
jgi:predicted PurR-regulated permease PerM